MIHLRAGRLLICYQRCNQIAEGGPTPRAPLCAAYFDPQARRPETCPRARRHERDDGTCPPPHRQCHGQGGLPGRSRGAKCWENGTRATIAETEKINESYVGRVLRLTLLAPDIVDATWVDGSRRR
jgi:hypothetical protein